MKFLPRMHPGAWLVLAAIGAGCAHAPPAVPEPEVGEPVLVTVAEPTCQAIQVADCGPQGDCRGVEMIGASCFRFILPGESLIEIARQYDLGFNEIEAANPGLDAFVPTVGATVAIPTAWIVPRAASTGKGARIVVNLSEMRLYLMPKGAAPMTFPVGVGSEGWTTPVGTFSVIQKQVNPPWYVPKKAWAGALAGTVVPPGPGDPLKARFMSFEGGAGIHGVDPSEYSSIGHNASHGCVRMRIPDVIALYAKSPVGTPVYII